MRKLATTAARRTRQSRPSAAAIDHFGRILIPKSLRDAAGLHEGSMVEIVRDGADLRLVHRHAEPLVQVRHGIPTIVGEVVGDVGEAVERHRADRLRELGGGR